MRKKSRKRNSQSPTQRPAGSAGAQGPLAAAARMLRLPLLPVAAGGAMTSAVLVNKGVVDASLTGPAIAASAVFIFATAFNDLWDVKTDAAGQGSPGRVNPLTQPRGSRRLASVLTTLGLLTAMISAVAWPTVNLGATVAALLLSGGYTVALKKHPPIGLMSLGLAAAAVTAIGLTGPDGKLWVLSPALTGYLVTLTMAFAWAWERRRPPLWGNNWFILILLCAAAFPALNKLCEHFDLRYTPEGVSPRNALLCAGLLLPITLAVFFRTAAVRRGTMLRFVGLIWLAPVWMAIIAAGNFGNAVFLPAVCLLVTVVFIQATIRLSAARR